MTIQQEYATWRDNAIKELDSLLRLAVMSPDLPPRKHRALADAAAKTLAGWKATVETFSISNKGYEFQDLPVATIHNLKSVEHMIKLLVKLGSLS